MNIITDNYKKLIKNVLENLITKNIDKLFSNLDTKNCIDNYINVIKNIDNFTFNIAQSMFQEIFKIIDDEFMNSEYRKKRFKSKGFKSRSMWTCLVILQLKEEFISIKSIIVTIFMLIDILVFLNVINLILMCVL